MDVMTAEATSASLSDALAVAASAPSFSAVARAHSSLTTLSSSSSASSFLTVARAHSSLAASSSASLPRTISSSASLPRTIRSDVGAGAGAARLSSSGTIHGGAGVSCRVSWPNVVDASNGSFGNESTIVTATAVTVANVVDVPNGNSGNESTAELLLHPLRCLLITAGGIDFLSVLSSVAGLPPLLITNTCTGAHGGGSSEDEDDGGGGGGKPVAISSASFGSQAGGSDAPSGASGLLECCSIAVGRNTAGCIFGKNTPSSIMVGSRPLRSLAKNGGDLLGSAVAVTTKPFPTTTTTTTTTIAAATVEVTVTTTKETILPSDIGSGTRRIRRRRNNLWYNDNCAGRHNQQIGFGFSGGSTKQSGYKKDRRGLISCIGGASIQTFVKTLDSSTIALNAQQSFTMMHAKFTTQSELLSQSEALIMPEHQRLYYGGKQLEDRFTLCDYNIQKEATLHLSLCLQGGMGKRLREEVESARKGTKKKKNNNNNNKSIIRASPASKLVVPLSTRDVPSTVKACAWVEWNGRADTFDKLFPDKKGHLMCQPVLLNWTLAEQQLLALRRANTQAQRLCLILIPEIWEFLYPGFDLMPINNCNRGGCTPKKKLNRALAILASKLWEKQRLKIGGNKPQPHLSQTEVPTVINAMASFYPSDIQSVLKKGLDALKPKDFDDTQCHPLWDKILDLDGNVLSDAEKNTVRSLSTRDHFRGHCVFEAEEASASTERGLISVMLLSPFISVNSPGFNTH